ncbi:hypothetical protein JTB14_024451 [Gonioctena quinquepunctata]|nr:hypothetical protein JTB14_024451 [Gonioctena quinquepunctata]
MEVKGVFVMLCLCVALDSTFARKVKTKSENLEETYGTLDDADVQNDDYYEEIGEAPPDETNDTLKPAEEEAVIFLTRPQLVIAKFGDTVRLPCEVSNPDVVTIWQKDGSLRYQGHLAVRKWPNLVEFENNTLDVNVTSNDDFGNYACVLITTNDEDKRPKLVHKIVPFTSPKITGIISANNRTEYQLGEILTLTCKATGYPKPDISWHLGSERLGIHGETLTIPDLKVENAGVYRCLADNKVSEPSHHHIEIHIEHEPIVKIEKYLVSSDRGEEAELTCTVDAYPTAHIVWKRNGENIVSNDKHNIKLIRHERVHESVLIISNLEDDSFGTYTCFAKNRLGKKEKKVNLVKTPAVRKFVKPEAGGKDVVLTWKVESKAPISMHEIQYRKKGDQKWNAAEPDVTDHVNNVYTVTYTLKDLEAGSYETRMRSKNKHGWSDYTEIMPFKGEKHVAPPEAMPAQHQENHSKEASVGASQPGDGSGSLTSSAAISCIALLFLYINRH